MSPDEVVARLMGAQKAFAKFAGPPMLGPSLAEVMKMRKTAAMEGVGKLDLLDVEEPPVRLGRPGGMRRMPPPQPADVGSALLVPIVVLIGVGAVIGYGLGAGWVGSAFGWITGVEWRPTATESKNE